jgi:hypothetical protein
MLPCGSLLDEEDDNEIPSFEDDPENDAEADEDDERDGWKSMRAA